MLLTDHMFKSISKSRLAHEQLAFMQALAQVQPSSSSVLREEFEQNGCLCTDPGSHQCSLGGLDKSRAVHTGVQFSSMNPKLGLKHFVCIPDPNDHQANS